MGSLFLIWKADSDRGQHIPIGELYMDGQEYCFRYVHGFLRAKAAGYVQPAEFPYLDQEYRSKALFPLFANRVLSSRRPEYKDYRTALGLGVDGGVLAELGRSGGRRVTDRYRIIAAPMRVAEEAEYTCFATGLTREPVYQLCDHLDALCPAGTELLLTPMVQNPYDPQAIMLHTKENVHVGWVPAHHTRDIQPFLLTCPHNVHCLVERLNLPINKKQPDILLIRITHPWPEGWRPMQDPEYEPLMRTAAVA